MKSLIPAMLLAAAMGMADEAMAQRFPGRGGGEHSRPESRRERETRDSAARPAHDPLGAIERELPSLKVDLLLRREQLDAWIPFERAVRDRAELDRASRRRLLGFRDAAATATGAGVLAVLVEDDRLKAEASILVARSFERLSASLDDAQRGALERRLLLSQTEPLGSERPPR